MDDTRRAIRQKKKLLKQFETRQDKAVWQGKWDEIIQAADSKQWSHAATLLERMTSALDKESKAIDDANELLEFVVEEWKVLRNQCEAAMIKSDDDERRKCEAAVSIATEKLDAGAVDDCLEQLSVADDMMEKLRRRI